jgi:Bacterial alpha-L-rhamnosidase C-terminal domain
LRPARLRPRRPRDYHGWFESSDDALNRVWYAGTYTLQLDMVPPGTQNDNPQPAVIDGAKRDRLQWSGDAVVEGPAIWDHLGANGSDYVKATLLDFAANATPSGAPPGLAGVNTPVALTWSATYSMDSANAMVDFYRYTWRCPRADPPTLRPHGASRSRLQRGALGEDGSDGSADDLTSGNAVDGTSLAHGWSTGPLIALSEQVLGETPIEPGYATWTIAPHVGDLRWAAGQVPTPYGPIAVRWHRSSAGLRLWVKAPSRTHGTVVPPVASRAIAISGGPRTHTLTVAAG